MALGLHALSAIFIGGTFIILLSTKNVLELEPQFVGYAIFHQNHVNKLSHYLCVWPILWTFLCMFQCSKPLSKALPFTNHAFFVAAMYFTFYLLISSGPLQGTGFTNLAAAMVLVCWLTSGLAAWLFPRRAGYVSAVINVLCWIAQFFTHGMHEGRAPALSKNPAQAFFFAPLFVLLEGLADSDIGEFKDKLAIMQPNVTEGIRLLDAGQYAQISQTDVQPVFVLAGLCYAAALFLPAMCCNELEKKKAL